MKPRQYPGKASSPQCDYTGKVTDGFNVIGETSGDWLFIIPEEERGTTDVDRVSVGDRIRIDWRDGFVVFERIRL